MIDMMHASTSFGRDEIMEEEKEWLAENVEFEDLGESCSAKHSAQNRFFAHSPYYDAFIEKEIHSAEILSNSMKNIGTKIEAYSKASTLLVKSMHSLSLSCRNCAEETETEMQPEFEMIKIIGEALEELSEAHKAIQSKIELALGIHFMECSAKQMNIVNKLKKERKETEVQTRLSEQKFFQYLNGKFAGGNFDNTSDTIHKASSRVYRRNTDAGSNIDADYITTRLQESQRRSSFPAATNNKIVKDNVFRREESPPHSRGSIFLSSRYYSRKVNGTISEPGDESDAVNKLADWKGSLENIRIEETKAELKRFQLCQSIVNNHNELRLDLTRNNAELLAEIQRRLQHCSRTLTSALSRVHHSHKQSLGYHDRNKPLWKEREKLLHHALAKMPSSGGINLLSDDDSDDNDDNEDNLQVSDIERDVEIWDLPSKLAAISLFRRPCPRDVLMEGWLYQKCSSIMSLQSSWVKRWFILKSNGIYYLESSVEGRNNLTTQIKIKLFDIVLCTIRELEDEPSARFCFQLIDHSNKSVTLQARGPKELQTWLDRIRSAARSQLAEAKPLVFSEVSPKLLRKESSEIRLTVVGDNLSKFWDEQKSHRHLEECDGSIISTTEKLESFGEMKPPLITQVLKANPTCADCGAGSPDWASLNLGILVCLECSGVHRSLGCHVSKVRSLELDELSEAEASLLLSLGNERVNKIWEKCIDPKQKALRKLACLDGRMAREDWIRSKYVKKEFLVSVSDIDDAGSKKNASQVLHHAVENGDVVGVASALALGASLDFQMNYGSDCVPRTALEISIMRKDDGKDGAIECTELLLQNGAKGE